MSNYYEMRDFPAERWSEINADLQGKGLHPALETWWTPDGAGFCSGGKRERLTWVPFSTGGDCWGSPEKTNWSMIEDFDRWVRAPYVSPSLAVYVPA